MTDFVDLSDKINKETGGSNGNPQNYFYYKVGRYNSPAGTNVAVNAIAGRNHSLWEYAGSPCGGDQATTEIIPTSSTPGALIFSSAQGGRESFLTQFWAAGLVAGTLMVYDRLYQKGNFVGNIATPQSVQGNPPSLEISRNVSGYGNFAFIEIYNLTAATTSRNLTMSYTNELGVSGRTSEPVLIGNTNFEERGRAIFMPLQSGDYGIRSIQSITLDGSVGTAGSFAVVIGKLVGFLGIAAGGCFGLRDYSTGLPGIPKLDPDSCLTFLWSAGSTTPPDIIGGYSITES